MADNIIYSSSQNGDYKARANESFDFLCTIRGNLNAEERERLLALSSPENLWKWAAFDWLEAKRHKYDPSYAALRQKEQALAVATKKLQDIEQEVALRDIVRQERLGSAKPSHQILNKRYAAWLRVPPEDNV